MDAKTKQRLAEGRMKMVSFLTSKGISTPESLAEIVNEYCKITGHPRGNKMAFKFVLTENLKKYSPIEKQIRQTIVKARKDKKKHRRKVLEPLDRSQYKTYIQSKRWYVFRKGLIKERGKVCQKCYAKNVPLHAHHLTYIRLGCEKPEDILIVCIPCHEEIHGRRFKRLKKSV